MYNALRLINFPSNSDLFGYIVESDDIVDMSEDMMELKLHNNILICGGWSQEQDLNGHYQVVMSYKLYLMACYKAKDAKEVIALTELLANLFTKIPFQDLLDWDEFYESIPTFEKSYKTTVPEDLPDRVTVTGQMVESDNIEHLSEDMMEVHLPNNITISSGWWRGQDPDGFYEVSVWYNNWIFIDKFKPNNMQELINFVELMASMFNRLDAQLVKKLDDFEPYTSVSLF